MKLFTSWAICNSLMAVNAIFLEPIPLVNGTRSDRTPVVLSLVAETRSNLTHVNVSITNTYSQQISVLKWNSLFQDNPNAAYGTFQLSQRQSNGSFQLVDSRSRVGGVRYIDPKPSHYFNLTPGNTYVRSFDLTKLFNVPSNGTYSLTLDSFGPGVLVPGGVELSKVLEEAGTQKGTNQSPALPAVRIKSETGTIYLQASSPTHILPKRGADQLCTSQAQAAGAVLRARGYARSLAKFAQVKALPPLGIGQHGLIDKTLWVQYFNNDSVTRNVSRIYTAIASYGLHGDTAGVTEFCDFNDTDHMCTDDGGAISYSTPGGGSTGPSVTFCSPFFKLPAALTCDAPGSNNNIMSDQGGVYLHELAKVQQFTGVANVTDGTDGDCWTWDCITSAAAHRNGENAWLLAGAYELFAYASRAALSPRCPKAQAAGGESQPGPPGGPPDEQRLPGVQTPVHEMQGGVTNPGDPAQGGGGSGSGGIGGSGGSGEGAGNGGVGG